MARRRREEHGNRERWLVSYADFITLLFAFFTTLYAISVVDAVKAKKLVHSIRESFGEGVLEMNHPSLLDGESGQPVELGTGTAGLREGGGEEALEHLAEQLEKLPLPEGVGDGVSFRLTERGLVITLAASLFFPSGGTGLPEEGREAIQDVAGAVRGLPNHVRIEGHTDSRPPKGGPHPTNWHLSAARAVEVLLELAGGGIPGHRLNAAGFGSERPIVSNTTAAGQRLNRRVEIVILRAHTPPQPRPR
jgi:chemotaxis protein MotB